MDIFREDDHMINDFISFLHCLNRVMNQTHGVSPQENIQRVGGVLQLQLKQQDESQQLNAKRCGSDEQRRQRCEVYSRTDLRSAEELLHDGAFKGGARTRKLILATWGWQSRASLTFCNDLLIDQLDSFRERFPQHGVGAPLAPETHTHTHTRASSSALHNDVELLLLNSSLFDKDSSGIKVPPITTWAQLSIIPLLIELRN